MHCYVQQWIIHSHLDTASTEHLSYTAMEWGRQEDTYLVSGAYRWVMWGPQGNGHLQSRFSQMSSCESVQITDHRSQITDHRSQITDPPPPPSPSPLYRTFCTLRHAAIYHCLAPPPPPPDLCTLPSYTPDNTLYSYHRRENGRRSTYRSPGAMGTVIGVGGARL